MTKLNLGCGSVHLPGWVNIDNEPGEYPDLIADVRHLPFEDGTADLVYASHLLEHFEWDDPVLEEWHRVLRPGGAIVIAVPDILAAWIAHKRGGAGWGPGGQFKIDVAYINAVAFGGGPLGPPWDRPGMEHKQIFVFDMLVERMRPLFPDAHDIREWELGPCSLGEYMAMGHKPEER